MNKLFHKGYFREIFRQLMVPGIVSAAILMIMNVGTAVSLLPTLFLMRVASFSSIPNGFALAYPMMIYVYVAGLALTFTAYGWLNKRSQSDFYHAVPVTRKQIYGTSFFAIMLWLLIGLTAYAFVHAMLYLVTGMPFNYVLFLCVFVNMIIGAVEVVGAVSLACAISGTRFVNFFAAVVILFMPRFLLTIMSEFVRVLAPNSLDCIAALGVFFDPSYNIFGTPYAAIIETLRSGTTYSIDFAKLPAMIWSFVYSCILVFLGGVAFNKRSSETAGMPAKSKLFQGAVRTAFGLPLLLILMYTIVSGDASLLLGVLLVMFAFIFYCLYELISTKSVKKMAKAMPLFAICIGISLLYLVIPHAIIGIEKNVKIDENNIKGYYSVRTGSGLMSMLGFGGGDNSYASMKLDDVEITDKDSIAIIAKAYERTRTYQDKADLTDNSGMWMLVRIDRKIGPDKVRNLFFTGAECVKLSENADKNEQYAKIGYEFPKGKKYYSVNGLGSREANELAKVYEEEFESLSPDIRKLLKTNQYGGASFLFELGEMSSIDPSSRVNASLIINGCLGARNFSEGYLINSYTPRSLAMYIELINKKNGAEGKEMLNELKVWFETGDEKDNPYFYVDLSNYNGLYYYNTIYSSFVSEDSGKKLPKDTDPEFYEVIKILSEAELTAGRDTDKAFMITVEVGWHESAPYELLYGSTTTLFISVSDEDYTRIFELMKQHEERYNNLWNEPAMFN